MDKTIRIREQTYLRLSKQGDLASSFDSTIQKLLDIAEQVARDNHTVTPRTEQARKEAGLVAQ